MEFHTWKGLIVILLIHHCKPQAETTQETETSPLDPELSPGEVVPEVAPPSLREVEDAVQEASKLGEERGAEEVLKELLERVVEAALGETGKGGGGEEVGEAAEEVEAEAGFEADVVEEEEEVSFKQRREKKWRLPWRYR
ncbi:protein FAM9A-like [Hypomesus transpacificus]|uniref:protein FAM9A-like n=1 Tax=Hypomesus transpacificus TaxID=137520 RepID=UPI001F07B799|nr:protein FAM9A-like [Hypomesus transpacificus]